MKSPGKCRRTAADEHHDLSRQVQNPNVHGLQKELTLPVETLGHEEFHSETLRGMSLNCSITLARGAFAAAIKAYPNQRMILKWRSYIVEKYDPSGMKKVSDG